MITSYKDLKNCRDCDFIYKDFQEQTRCRRFPPSIVTEPREKGSIQYVYSTHPPVNINTPVCGEYVNEQEQQIHLTKFGI
jgi:hypothetical protein